MGPLDARLRQLYHRARGIPLEFALGRYEKVVARIDTMATAVAPLSDPDIAQRGLELRKVACTGTPTDELLVEMFALLREAADRAIGLRAHPEQLVGAVVLHQGKVAQLQTGEGKTLVAVFPAALEALTGRGAHVLTFNDYLARRDADWMGPIYRALGLSVAAVQEGMSADERRQAWAADVTYATARECGFDHLRDARCTDADARVHRPFNYAIVDEADSILVDEARIPLVIAGSALPPDVPPARMTEVVRTLVAARHVDTDEHGRNALTDDGLDHAERLLGCGPLHDPASVAMLAALNQALHAEVLLSRDVDYIVRDGEVELVDEFTGRVAEDRRWPDGLQAALEAKEGLDPKPEGMVLGSIALQHFLQLYPRLAGMTATAASAADELGTFYGLGSVVVPPHRPCVREDLPDVVFTHAAARERALVEEIAAVNASGRPVLVGTASVDASEALAAALKRRGVPCEVLNARNDAREAAVIEQAGRLGAVTISTNMAGRGTDIRLGGNDEGEHDTVTGLGGLFVIGTNRHESVRIDDQLRGRAGRQGDPGASRFFISLEDDLVQRHADEATRWPPRQDGPLDDPVVARQIAHTQRVVEGQNFQIRKTLFRYSTIVENQREQLMARRDAWLLGEAPTVVAACGSDSWERVCREHGEPHARAAERTLALALLDALWADHLADVADIREGIHLHSLSGTNPFGAGQDPQVAFHRRVALAFQQRWDDLDDALTGRFDEALITAAGVDLGALGLESPASTWTYIINDDPFGDVLSRAARNIGRRVKKLVGKEPT